MKNKFLTAFLSVLCSACNVGPNYERPAFYDNQSVANVLGMKTNGTAVLNERWYERYQDDVLNNLIHEAETRNLSVKQALWALRQARSQTRIAFSSLFPVFDAEGGHTRTHASKNNPLSFREDYFTLGLDASWELDIWGGKRRQIEAQNALFLASEQNLRNVLLSVKAEVVNTYILLNLIRQKQHLLQTNIDLQKALLLITQKQFKNGLAEQADLNLSSYSLEKMNALLPELKEQEENCLNALAVLTARLPGTLSLPENKENIFSRKNDIFHFDFDDIRRLPVSVLYRRPDVKMAENKLIAENASIGVRIADLLPNIGIGAFFGFQSTSFRQLINSASQTASLQPQIKMPLLHWGALINAVDMQKSATKIAVLTYQTTLLNAVKDIKNALTALQNAYLAFFYQNDSVFQMQQALDLNLIKYEKGLISLSDLLTQTQNLLQAQTDLLSSKQKIYQSVTAVYKSLGL